MKTTVLSILFIVMFLPSAHAMQLVLKDGTIIQRNNIIKQNGEYCVYLKGGPWCIPKDQVFFLTEDKIEKFVDRREKTYLIRTDTNRVLKVIDDEEERANINREESSELESICSDAIYGASYSFSSGGFPGSCVITDVTLRQAIRTKYNGGWAFYYRTVCESISGPAGPGRNAKCEINSRGVYSFRID